jgi:Family of unknown function (DUF6807)
VTAIPRCQVMPQAGHHVVFQVDGREVLRWHAGTAYPRPYFFPVVGPSGASITRMGHPGAPSHDHHQSLWFAHHKVLGMDFWGNASGTRIRQSQWFAYEDRDDECRMAVELIWLDGHDPAPLLKQELICCVRPQMARNEFTIELHSRFVPVSQSLEFQQTNFGCLAVRMAKSISGFFGGGRITSSEGRVEERNVFGRGATWMDYSGENGVRNDSVTEGLTYIDHPSNPGQPTGWHVREDGWMCASPTMNSSIVTSQKAPLTLRYLLLVHSGPVDADRNNALHTEFADRPALSVGKPSQSHTAWEIRRAGG